VGGPSGPAGAREAGGGAVMPGAEVLSFQMTAKGFARAGARGEGAP